MLELKRGTYRGHQLPQQRLRVKLTLHSDTIGIMKEFLRPLVGDIPTVFRRYTGTKARIQAQFIADRPLDPQDVLILDRAEELDVRDARCEYKWDDIILDFTANKNTDSFDALILELVARSVPFKVHDYINDDDLHDTEDDT